MRAFAAISVLVLAMLAGCTSQAGEASIHGKVYDGGRGVGDAKVTLDNGDETTTGADGSFHFSGLAEKEYTVKAEAGGKSGAVIVTAKVGDAATTGVVGINLR